MMAVATPHTSEPVAVKARSSSGRSPSGHTLQSCQPAESIVSATMPVQWHLPQCEHEGADWAGEDSVTRRIAAIALFDGFHLYPSTRNARPAQATSYSDRNSMVTGPAFTTAQPPTCGSKYPTSYCKMGYHMFKCEMRYLPSSTRIPYWRSKFCSRVRLLPVPGATHATTAVYHGQSGTPAVPQARSAGMQVLQCCLLHTCGCLARRGSFPPCVHQRIGIK